MKVLSGTTQTVFFVMTKAMTTYRQIVRVMRLKLSLLLEPSGCTVNVSDTDKTRVVPIEKGSNDWCDGKALVVFLTPR